MTILLALPIALAVSCPQAAEKSAQRRPPTRKAAPISFSEQEIRGFYDRHREKLFVTSRRVWVKAIIAPTLEKAAEARRRAKAGDDFDALIAEYFVPYFAAHRKQGHLNKQVDFGWVDPETFLRRDKATGPLSGLKVGDMSEPHPLFGKGPEFAVLKILAERPATAASLREVRDDIYSRLWDDVADTKMLEDVGLGGNAWCGTCRAGRDVNGQLWHLAQHHSERGDARKAINACLLALREARRSLRPGGPEAKENALFPEEQYLADHGMDVMRYYSGVMDRVLRGHGVRLRDSLPTRVRLMKDEWAVPALTRLVANRGRWCEIAAHTLGAMKAKSAAPALKDMLADRHLRIAELSWGGKQAVYAHYPLRVAARAALRRMGIDPGEVKVVVGAVEGDPLPKNYR